MDNERLKKMLLIALSSTHGGEALAAIGKVKEILAKDKKDIHWLVDRLAVPETPVSDALDEVLRKAARGESVHPQYPWQDASYERQRTRGRTYTQQFADNWVEALTTCHFWMPLGIFKRKEEDFLHSLSQQALERKYTSWRPSDRQMQWLYDLWLRVNAKTKEDYNR